MIELDETTICIEFTARELLIARWCVRHVNESGGLHEMFEDDDSDATQDDENIKRPTDALIEKLAIYHYPGDDAFSVLEAILAQDTAHRRPIKVGNFKVNVKPGEPL